MWVYMVRIKIVTSDLKILGRVYMARVEIVEDDLKILDRGYI